MKMMFCITFLSIAAPCAVSHAAVAERIQSKFPLRTGIDAEVGQAYSTATGEYKPSCLVPNAIILSKKAASTSTLVDPSLFQLIELWGVSELKNTYQFFRPLASLSPAIDSALAAFPPSYGLRLAGVLELSDHSVDSMKPIDNYDALSDNAMKVAGTEAFAKLCGDTYVTSVHRGAFFAKTAFINFAKRSEESLFVHGTKIKKDGDRISIVYESEKARLVKGKVIVFRMQYGGKEESMGMVFKECDLQNPIACFELYQAHSLENYHTELAELGENAYLPTLAEKASYSGDVPADLLERPLIPGDLWGIEKLTNAGIMNLIFLQYLYAKESIALFQTSLSTMEEPLPGFEARLRGYQNYLATMADAYEACRKDQTKCDEVLKSVSKGFNP